MPQDNFSDLSTDVTEQSDVNSERAEAEYAEMVDEMIRVELQSFAARNREIAAELSARLLTTDDILFGNVGRYAEAMSSYRRLAVVAENAAAAENPREYLDNYFREQREIRDRDQARRDASANRWFAQSMGLKMGGLVALTIMIPVLIELFSRRSADQPSSDIQLFPDDSTKEADMKEMLFAHHDLWMNQSDHDYWTFTMAPIATNCIPLVNARPTVGDHLFYLNLTKAISRLEDPFVWDSGDDYMAIVNDLVNSFDLDAPTHIADLYKQLPILRYRDEPLPRSIAADVMQAALGLIAKRQST